MSVGTRRASERRLEWVDKLNLTRCGSIFTSLIDLLLHKGQIYRVKKKYVDSKGSQARLQEGQSEKLQTGLVWFRWGEAMPLECVINFLRKIQQLADYRDNVLCIWLLRSIEVLLASVREDADKRF